MLRTQLNKAQTGIHGLPQIYCTLLAGGPDCGKTALALQILVNGTKMVERACLVEL